MSVESNNRIAKNTIVLYIRTLFIMVVTLYTGRVILDVLGVSDYGVYNVIAGVTGLIGFLRGALGSSAQRFINYEMGCGRLDNLKRVFSMSFYCFLLVSVISLVLAESVGLWFVENKLNIPNGRIDAAVFMYHCTVFMFVVNMLIIPFHSDIIAHEEMSIYAYFSIIDALLKLFIVYLLTIIPIDKLKLYALLLVGVNLTMTACYVVYCYKKFPESHIVKIWDKALMQKIFSFSGWMLIGTVTNVLSTQGINMLINIFFNPIYNAARGIAVQVYGAVSSLAGNFLVAVQPQIVQSYASCDVQHSYKLVFSSSKLSAFLTFTIALPIMLNADYILNLWLVDVPDMAPLFVNLVIIDFIITTAYAPIFNIAQAANKVRNYELVVSVSFIIIFGLSWVAFRFGSPVQTTFIIAIIVDFLGLFARLVVLHHDTKFPVVRYCKQVIAPILTVLILSWFIGYLPTLMIRVDNFLLLIVHAIICVFATAVLIWLIGTDSAEKLLVRNAITKVTNNLKRQ